MKNKLQYTIIGILLISNIYFIFIGKKSKIRNNSEFKNEMNYLKKRIEFDEDQLKLAVKTSPEQLSLDAPVTVFKQLI